MISEDIHPRSGVLRVLVVDDDPVSLALCRETFGHTQHAAYQGAYTLDDARHALFTQGTPHEIIFVDLNLSKDERGETLCRELRDPKSKIFAPLSWVIAFTSEKSLKTVHEVLLAGANDYLVKPLDPENLLIKLEIARFAHARTRALKVRTQLLEQEVERMARETVQG